MPLMKVVKTVSDGESFYWDLGKATNSLERSEYITAVKKAWAVLETHTLSPSVSIKKNDDGSTFDLEFQDLEALRAKCLYN